jgi:hypothetical protein
MSVKTEFPIFKTVKLGVRMNNTIDLIMHMHSKGILVSSEACEMIIHGTEFSDSVSEVVLHIATVEEITGKESAIVQEINDAIMSHGYDLCSSEVGPLLRLKYNDSDEKNWTLIAMEPIDGHIHCLRRYGKKQLDFASSGIPGIKGISPVVFMSRK